MKTIIRLSVLLAILTIALVSCEKDKKTEETTVLKITMTTKPLNEVYFYIYGSGIAAIDFGDEFGKQTVNIMDYPNSIGKFQHHYPDEASRTITIYGENITHFLCSGQGQLTSLDVSKGTELTYLECVNNQLTILDVSNNTALTYLDCSINQLTSLDVSNNTALIHLGCTLNQLTSLDLSSCTALTMFWCHSNNQLTSLNFSGCTILTELYCYGNDLISLNLSSNVALELLICRRNPLTGLDLSNNTALRYLDCRWSEFDADVLDALFETLNDNEENKIINIYGNPGISDCNPNIARNKSWLFNNSSQI